MVRVKYRNKLILEKEISVIGNRKMLTTVMITNAGNMLAIKNSDARTEEVISTRNVCFSFSSARGIHPIKIPPITLLNSKPNDIKKTDTEKGLSDNVEGIMCFIIITMMIDISGADIIVGFLKIKFNFKQKIDWIL